jgi:hypothetical protein
MIREKAVVGFAKTGCKVDFMHNSDKRLHLLAGIGSQFRGCTSTGENQLCLLTQRSEKAIYGAGTLFQR